MNTGSINLDLPQIMPHKDPMIVIDKIIDFDTNLLELKANFTINEDDIFFDSLIDATPSLFGLEYMAQAIAALSGIVKSSEGKKVNLGLIIGCRKYETSIDYFKKGEIYLITIKKLFFDDTLGSFQCFIYDSLNNLVASSQINVFTPNDSNAFLSKLKG